MKNVALLSVLLWTSLAILFGFVQNVKAQGSSPAFSNPDEPIDVAVNQEFKIVLDANPTTGFLWQLSEPLDEAIVRFVRDNYDIAEVPGLTGGGGETHLDLPGGRPGTDGDLIFLFPPMGERRPPSEDGPL